MALPGFHHLPLPGTLEVHLERRTALHSTRSGIHPRADSVPAGNDYPNTDATTSAAEVVGTARLKMIEQGVGSSGVSCEGCCRGGGLKAPQTQRWLWGSLLDCPNPRYFGEVYSSAC